MKKRWSMSVARRVVEPNSPTIACDGIGGVYVMRGVARVGDKIVEAGEAAFCDSAGLRPGNDSRADILHFEVRPAPDEGSAPASKPIVLEALFALDQPLVVIRMDEVRFPSGACAYRHTHPGPGIRYLTEGMLEIESDHATTEFHAGEAWFEDAVAPVQATAGALPSTRFIRMLVLPPEFENKPTFTYLNDEDREKPRLQTNKRFFDHRLRLPG